MSKIISIEPVKKNSTLVRVELSNGQRYSIGYWGLIYVEAPEIYGRVLQHILDQFEESEETDLKAYLQSFYARAKDNSLMYVIPDDNGERERIGRLIRELRSTRKMDAKRLAVMANIDPANISRIEQGKYSVGLDVLCRIADALDSRVEIVPNGSHIEKGNQMTLSRKVWVIPTLESEFYPIATFPGCGFNLLPNKYGANINVGDLVVFYLTRGKRYDGPYFISATNFKYSQLGEFKWVFEDLAKFEDQEYIKIEYCPDLSETDAISIKERIRIREEAPTNITEL